MHGVWVASDTFPELGIPKLRGVVRVPHVELDGTQAARGASFDKLLATLRPVADSLRARRTSGRAQSTT
ncbi:MAG: hypothetical protein R3F61_34105 [Myxococcota bacterium]